MLSEKAFNAFLKTLEEPPPHAKFVFATTEIRKVPVTILSRCQRFDLRRVEAGALIAHLQRICDAEGVAAEPEALAAIARAAEGSVRDSLSLLDQAIAHGAGRVSAETVRDMLGLADRARVIDLFEAAMRGDAPAAFAELRAQHEAGADPSVVLQDLAEFTHLVTRLKVAPESARADGGLSEAERGRGSDFADRLSVRALSRAWQILLKAIPEVQAAPRPLAAAEMALVRLIYAADLPTPDEALRQVREGSAPALPPGGRTPPVIPAGGPALRAVPDARPRLDPAPQPRPALAAAPAAEAAPAVRLRRFEDVVALADERRDIGLKAALERDAHLVRFEEGRIEFRIAPGGRTTLANDLARALDRWTGRRWVVALSKETGEPTLAARAKAAVEKSREGAAAHPLVQAVLKGFPGAQIIDVREKASEAEPDEVAPPEEPEADL
jgi:DNA polymerase III subunit gamma/tau